MHGAHPVLEGTEDRLVRESSVSAVEAATNVVVKRIRGPHLLLQTFPQLAWRLIEEFLSRQSDDQ
jgi:hypothetical protein